MKKFILIFILLFAVQTVFAQRSEPEKTEVHGHTMYTLMNPGEIPAIFDPEFISVIEAESLYYADEMLMVVKGDNEIKGYSTWYLDAHEIVNDYINGKAITITW